MIKRDTKTRIVVTVCAAMALLACVRAKATEPVRAVVTGEMAASATTHSLSNPTATPETVNLYQLLWKNYGEKILSGAMAEVAWNTKEADRVYRLTGKYPAINGFDYIHLPYSGENWIDYTDISPVADWAEKGGIVTISWHWNVPTLPLAADKVAIRTCGIQRYHITGDSVQTLLAGVAKGDRIFVRYEKADAKARAGFWAADNTTLKDADGLSYGNFPIGGSRSAYGKSKCDATAFSIELDDAMLGQIHNGFSIVGSGYVITGVNLVKKGSDVFTFNPEKTSFKMSRALVEGSLENKIIKADLDKVASCLKLLQDKHIAVLWRPLHEAAGGWFWWGASTREDFIALWRYMYHDFARRGLNNLIWVWTSEQKTPSWYPGDEYVDIIGRDRYNVSDALTMTDMYNDMKTSYPDKIITLSECGSVPPIDEQWKNGAMWSWFMPWYGEATLGVPHATDLWWKDATQSDKVLYLDDIREMKRDGSSQKVKY